MADGILPVASVVPVEREILHDVVVDLVQRQLLLRRALDSHGYEGDVGEGGGLWCTSITFSPPLASSTSRWLSVAVQ